MFTPSLHPTPPLRASDRGRLQTNRLTLSSCCSLLRGRELTWQIAFRRTNTERLFPCMPLTQTTCRRHNAKRYNHVTSIEASAQQTTEVWWQSRRHRSKSGHVLDGGGQVWRCLRDLVSIKCWRRQRRWEICLIPTSDNKNLFTAFTYETILPAAASERYSSLTVLGFLRSCMLIASGSPKNAFLR